MIRMTDNYNLDTSNWRGRVFLAKIYGYGGYNYYYFGVILNINFINSYFFKK